MDGFPKSTKWTLDTAKAAAKVLHMASTREINAASFALTSKLPFKAMALREMLLQRTSDLFDAAILLADEGSIVSSIILVRSTMETMALLHRLQEVSAEFLKTKDESAFDDFLTKGLLGSRDGSNNIVAINILTVLGHMDRNAPGIRKLYDALSEVAHPNYSGLMAAYSRPMQGGTVLMLGKDHRKRPVEHVVLPLALCFEYFQASYDRLADLVKEINDMYETDVSRLTVMPD